MTTLTETPKQPLALKILGIVTLAGLGALTGYGVAHIALMRDQSWADSLATSIAVALLAIAAMSAVTLVRRPSTVPRGCGILQITVFVLAAVMLLLPMFGPAWASADVIFGGIAILLAVQSLANLMLWRAADEMLRRIMAETSVMAFWVLQTALFLYAAAERLGLVESITAWGLTGILMAVYLLASIVASARRGLH
tara:strand:- start:2207 stop:2794 length:588 start_codon:yes stop_codon:yes gene_type:complete